MERYNIQPAFGSELTSTLFRMESVRNRFVASNTPRWLFYDLKETLHILESLNSARIEGNHTTLIEIIDEATRPADEHEAKAADENIAEIVNIRNAINYLENNLSAGDKITLKLVRELQSLVVRGLKGEGRSQAPGTFRRGFAHISQSECVTSAPNAIQSDMQELLAYINAPHEPKEDLIRIACAHHRFVVIHPFDNGNGRTARLLTYAMLIQYGFLQQKKNLLNPSSFFCMDHQAYYKMLGRADSGRRTDIEAWCNYFATGIMSEIDKMFRLLDPQFAVDEIVMPAIKAARRDERLSEQEYKIMQTAVEHNVIQAADVNFLFGTSPSDQVMRSRFLAKMVNDGLLLRPPKHPKKYVPRFFNHTLLPYVTKMLADTKLITGD